MMKRSIPVAVPMDLPAASSSGGHAPPPAAAASTSRRRIASGGGGSVLAWMLGCITVAAACMYYIWGPAMPSYSGSGGVAPPDSAFSWRLDEKRRAAEFASRKPVFLPSGPSAAQGGGRVNGGGLNHTSTIFPVRQKRPAVSGQRAPPHSMALACVAHAPSKDQPGLIDFSFYRRFQYNPPRTNLAVLTREARFLPELSPSPLIQSYFTPGDGGQQPGRSGSALSRSAAAEWLSRTLGKSPCTSQRNNSASIPPPIVVLTTCRDQPKRAWEHVAYHALLGATRVVMLDVSSGTRPLLPSLTEYLAPWLVPGAGDDAARGSGEGGDTADGAHRTSLPILELVPGASYLHPTMAADGDDGGRGGGVGLDTEDAAVARDVFFRTAPQHIARQHPDAVLVLLDDVNDFVLITAAPTTAHTSNDSNATTGAPATPATVRSGEDPAVPSPPFLCIADVYNPSSSNAAHVVSLPKITVGASALYDNARTPFERIHFASGDSDTLMQDAMRYVRRATAAAGGGGVGTVADSRHPLLSSFGIIANARGIAQHEAYAAHGQLPVTHTRFPDGTSWQQVQRRLHHDRGDAATVPLSTAFGARLDTATFTARVVRVAHSLQSELETAVDACYRTASKGPRRGGAPAAAPGGSAFDVGRVRSPRGSNIDDLPPPNGLRRNGFLTLHALLLQLMKYPSKGRRERTFPQLDVVAMPQIQKLLAPYAVYGNVDLSLTGGVAPSAPGFDITNENLVSGAVRLLPERPLIAGLNTTNLDAVLHNLFRGRACPSLRPPPANQPPPLAISGDSASILAAAAVSGPTHDGAAGGSGGALQLNVTFCTVVRNRAKLTLEWILYHKMLGVGRFVVVDDASTDGLAALLAPLVARGVVVLANADDGSNVYRFRNHVVKGPLLAGYGMCVEQELARAEREGHERAPWIGFLDSDEFTMLPTGECIPELVSRVVREHPQRRIGAVAFSWRTVAPLNNDLFDTSPTQFHRTAFSRGIADRIQRIKVIADASLAEAMETAHKVELRHGAQTVFPNGKPVTGPGWYTGVSDATEAQGIVLHYHARSLVSWMQRYLDGFADNNDHQWPFDLNTYFGRWFADTAKTISKADRAWMEAIPGWKERIAVVEALMTGGALPAFV